jgi:hypothetical protein
MLAAEDVFKRIAGVLLSMTGRRRDSAGLLAIRRQNSAA